MTSPLAFVGIGLTQNHIEIVDSDSDCADDGTKLASVVAPAINNHSEVEDDFNIEPIEHMESTETNTGPSCSTKSTSGVQNVPAGSKRTSEHTDIVDSEESNQKVVQAKQTNHKTFGEYDFTKALNTCAWPNFEQTPPVKPYRVKLKEGDQEVFIMRFRKENCERILTILSERFRLPIKRTRLQYPLKLQDGQAETITIDSWAKDLKQSLEDFYSQTDAMCLLEVSVCKAKESNRGERPNETKHKKVKKNAIVDRDIYEILQGDPEIAETFVQKQKYIATLLVLSVATGLMSQ